MNEVELNPSSLAFIEALYERFLDDPESVDAPWRSFFESEAGRNGFRHAAPPF